jgi:hypothetical protein
MIMQRNTIQNSIITGDMIWTEEEVKSLCELELCMTKNSVLEKRSKNVAVRKKIKRNWMLNTVR